MGNDNHSSYKSWNGKVKRIYLGLIFEKNFICLLFPFRIHCNNTYVKVRNVYFKFWAKNFRSSENYCGCKALDWFVILYRTSFVASTFEK